MTARRLVTLSKCRATTYGVYVGATHRDGAGFAQDVVTRPLPRITRRRGSFPALHETGRRRGDRMIVNTP